MWKTHHAAFNEKGNLLFEGEGVFSTRLELLKFYMNLRLSVYEVHWHIIECPMD